MTPLSLFSHPCCSRHPSGTTGLLHLWLLPLGILFPLKLPSLRLLVLYFNVAFLGKSSWTPDSEQQHFPNTPSTCPALLLTRPCFLGHLTLDLFHNTLQTVSPMSSRHPEQYLVHISHSRGVALLPPRYPWVSYLSASVSPIKRRAVSPTPPITAEASMCMRPA